MLSVVYMGSDYSTRYIERKNKTYIYFQFHRALRYSVFHTTFLLKTAVTKAIIIRQMSPEVTQQDP